MSEAFCLFTLFIDPVQTRVSSLQYTFTCRHPICSKLAIRATSLHPQLAIRAHAVTLQS